ncbi:hypothetical protein SUGI_1196830 [Cryptomeria japonica]|nr:hypothetical protein SUGI_1196830 [Cryptomeria japonica]
MVWELAIVVCVEQDIQRLDAMKKSKQFMKGKRVTALTLYVLYTLVMGGVQSYSVYRNGEQVISMGVIVVVVVFQCVVDLVWLLTHVVLYFVSKSCHREDIDKSALSNHLETYNGGYVLL